jgi:hypothetical protein
VGSNPALASHGPPELGFHVSECASESRRVARAAGVVQIQDVDRCTADLRETRNACAFEHEIVGPPIAPRVKEPRDLSRLRIDSGEVRSLTKIAAVARERQIFCPIGSAVLLCDDVLDMMLQFAVLLVQPAVLAALT